MYRHALPQAQANFWRHVVKPLPTPLTPMAGFDNKHGAAIALPDLTHEFVKRLAAHIAQVPMRRRANWQLPLVAVVIIQPDDVQVARRAAQLRLNTAAQHVPGLERGIGFCTDDFVKLSGRLSRGHYMDQRVAVHEARRWIHLANHLARALSGAYKLHFYGMPVVRQLRCSPRMLHQPG